MQEAREFEFEGKKNKTGFMGLQPGYLKSCQLQDFFLGKQSLELSNVNSDWGEKSLNSIYKRDNLKGD